MQPIVEQRKSKMVYYKNVKLPEVRPIAHSAAIADEVLFPKNLVQEMKKIYDFKSKG